MKKTLLAIITTTILGLNQAQALESVEYTMGKIDAILCPNSDAPGLCGAAVMSVTSGPALLISIAVGGLSETTAYYFKVNDSHKELLMAANDSASLFILNDGQANAEGELAGAFDVISEISETGKEYSDLQKAALILLINQNF